MELIKFIESKKEFLNIRRIERECGIPQGLIAKVLNGDRSMPVAHSDSLIKFFKQFGATMDAPRNPVDSSWVRVDNIGQYKRRKDGRYEKGGKLYETKFDGGFLVREI
jgi:hypothetical protein